MNTGRGTQTGYSADRIRKIGDRTASLLNKVTLLLDEVILKLPV
jgi:hypothetical protein